MSSQIAARPATGPVVVPLGGVLTHRAERLIRVGSVGSALVIATCAMVLSYSGLLDLALDAKIHPHLALLVPIMVDGLQFVGSLGVVYSTLSGLRAAYPWVLMLMGVSISAWGNWQAAPDFMTARLLHAASPIILALVLEELLRVMRHKVQVHAARYEQEQAALQAAAQAAEQVGDATAGPVAVTDETPAAVSPVAMVPLAEPAAPVPATPASRPAPAAAEGVTAPEPAPVAAPVAVVEPSPAAADLAPEPVRTRVEPAGPTWTPREPVLPLNRDPERRDPARPAAAPAAPTPSMTAPAVTGQSTTGDEDDVLPDYPDEAPFKEQVKVILSADPETTAAKIARVMGKDPSYTRRMVREVRAEMDAAPDTTAPAASPAPREVAASAGPAHRAEDAQPTAQVRSLPAPVAAVESGDESGLFDGADPFAGGPARAVGGN